MAGIFNGLRAQRSALAATAALALLVQPVIAAPDYHPVLVEEGRSKSKCEADPSRIFIKAGKLSECISTFVTRGHEAKTWAVLFFDGDSSAKDFANPALQASGLKNRHDYMQRWADKLGVRYVYVSRVGLMGSSGDHGRRGRPDETLIMNVAIDLIKKRLVLDHVVLAGQSRGSTIAALLVGMRHDVSCAVLGSGAFELVDLEYAAFKKAGYKVTRDSVAKGRLDPSAEIAEIVPDDARRIFLLADPADKSTPYEQQLRYAEALRAAGHHGVLVTVDALGENDHIATGLTIPAAGVCGRLEPDARVVHVILPKPRAPQAKPVASAGRGATLNLGAGK